MTPDAFAPYGTLLVAGDGRHPDYGDADSIGWRHRVALAGTPELVVTRTSFIGRRFSRLERHRSVSQAFVPLSGVPAAVAVARPSPTAPEPPRPEDVHAFAVTPGIGYLLHVDTWHSLDRFPLWPGHLDVLMLTAVETTEEAATKPKDAWSLTHEVDYREYAGLEFEFVLDATSGQEWS